MRLPLISKRIDDAVARASADAFRQGLESANEQHVRAALDPLYRASIMMSSQSPMGSTGWMGQRRWLSPQAIRSVARTYDPVVSITRHLQREVTSRDIAFRRRGDGTGIAKVGARKLAKAEQFFSTSGGLGGFQENRVVFERRIIADLCAMGAAAVKMEESRGELIQCQAVDSSTIRVLVDEYGFPQTRDDLPAYTQQLIGGQTQGITRRELYYSGLSPDVETPYFHSPIEAALAPLNMGMGADRWNQAFFDSGISPDEMFIVPEGYTAQQVKDYIDVMAARNEANPAARRKLFPLPKGSQILPKQHKDVDFTNLEQSIRERLCGIYGVTPSSMGWASRVYKAAQEGQTSLTSSFGVGEIIQFLKAFYDHCLERIGCEDLEVVFIEQYAEGRAERAGRLAQAVGKWITINEAREQEGLPPIEGGDDLGTPQEVTDEEAAEELRNWRQSATRAIRSGLSADVDWRSSRFGQAFVARVSARLAECESEAQVAKVFQSFLGRGKD